MLLPVAPAEAAPSRLERTRREIRATRTKLRSVMRDDAQIRAALARITRQLNRETSKLNSARLRLTRLDVMTRSAERRLDRLAASRAARARVISQRAAALYIMGPIDPLTAATHEQSIDEFVRRAGAIEFIASFDRVVLQDLGRIAHETRLMRRALRRQYAEVASIRNEVADRVAVVAEAAAVKREAHEALDRRIDVYQAELDALEREQQRILNIIRSRSSQGSVDTGNPSRLGFVWPTAGRRITSPYGPRGRGYHTGMDIDCRTGDTIVAAKDGRVIASEWGGGYGNMVIIDHGGGYATLYAHMSRRYAGDGQTVDQRQAIGACGTTGNSSGDHLHFEVRYNGNHRNPRPYLP